MIRRDRINLRIPLTPPLSPAGRGQGEGRTHGSVLITALWILAIFVIFTAELGFQGSQHILLTKREADHFQSKTDFISGLNLVYEKLLQDPEPHEDSPEDSWFGKMDLPDIWKKALTIKVNDEESRINLNMADEKWIREFLKEFSQENGDLKGDPKHFVKQILKQRKKNRIRSL